MAKVIIVDESGIESELECESVPRIGETITFKKVYTTRILRSSYTIKNVEHEFLESKVENKVSQIKIYI